MATEALLDPTPAQVAEATAAELDQRDAIETYAEETLGQAVRVLLGTCASLDTTRQTMQVQRQEETTTFIAQYGSLPVTPALIGQSVLCLHDPVTRLVYFRIGLSGTSTGAS